VLYLQLIILSVEGDISVDSEALLVTDFINLKIKLAQSFRVAHMGRVCVHVFIEVSVRMCINIYVYTVFLNKRILQRVHTCLSH
jgi:glucan phosphoethanolaminetransferase (alkaline phosphatase superfamily)